MQMTNFLLVGLVLLLCLNSSCGVATRTRHRRNDAQEDDDDTIVVNLWSKDDDAKDLVHHDNAAAAVDDRLEKGLKEKDRGAGNIKGSVNKEIKEAVDEMQNKMRIGKYGQNKMDANAAAHAAVALDNSKREDHRDAAAVHAAAGLENWELELVRKSNSNSKEKDKSQLENVLARIQANDKRVGKGKHIAAEEERQGEQDVWGKSKREETKKREEKSSEVKVRSAQRLLVQHLHCSNKPCLNRGRCIDLADGFLCQCPTGFHGDQCEVDVVECSMNPCENNGLCLRNAATASGYVCKCRAGFAGSLCERESHDEPVVHESHMSTTDLILEKVGGVFGLAIIICLIVVCIAFICIVQTERKCTLEKYRMLSEMGYKAEVPKIAFTVVAGRVLRNCCRSVFCCGAGAEEPEMITPLVGTNKTMKDAPVTVTR